MLTVMMAAGFLGYMIDGTATEYVHIPHADNSLYHIPESITDDAAVMLSDILPTGFEIGVLNGQVKPGDTVAIEVQVHWTCFVNSSVLFTGTYYYD